MSTAVAATVKKNVAVWDVYKKFMINNLNDKTCDLIKQCPDFAIGLATKDALIGTEGKLFELKSTLCQLT